MDHVIDWGWSLIAFALPLCNPVLNEAPYEAARCKLFQFFDVAIPLSMRHFQKSYAFDGERDLLGQLIHSCDD